MILLRQHTQCTHQNLQLKKNKQQIQEAGLRTRLQHHACIRIHTENPTIRWIRILSRNLELISFDRWRNR